MGDGDLSRLLRRRAGLHAEAVAVSLQLCQLFRSGSPVAVIEGEISAALAKAPAWVGGDPPWGHSSWNMLELLSQPELRASARIFLAGKLKAEGVAFSSADLPEVSSAGLACLFRLCQAKAALGRPSEARALPPPGPDGIRLLTIADAYLLACFPALSRPKPSGNLSGWDQFMASDEADDFWGLVTVMVDMSRGAWPASPTAIFSEIGREWLACSAFRGMRRSVVRAQLAQGRRVGGPPAFLTWLLVDKDAGYALSAPVRHGLPVAYCAMAAEAARLVVARQLASKADTRMWVQAANALIRGCPEAAALLIT